MVRNRFENAVRRLADRIGSKAPVTKELLTQLHQEDLNFPRVPAGIFENISERRFAVRRAGCQNASSIPARYVGKRVNCTKCDEVFAAWGDPCER
jgi:hypothetical protein